MSRSTDLPVEPVIDMAPETVRQIEELDLKDGPLILCDVDEVALHFIAPFERHLLAHGFELIARSYGLNGNIVHIDGQAPASREEVRDLLLGFFDAETGNQQPVAGVAEALGELSQAAGSGDAHQHPGKAPPIAVRDAGPPRHALSGRHQ